MYNPIILHSIFETIFFNLNIYTIKLSNINQNTMDKKE